MKPPKLYSAAVNLNGLVSEVPMQLLLRKKWSIEGKDRYWDKSGDWDATGPGEVSRDGYIQYTSMSKTAVELWLRGAKSFRKMVKNLC